MSRRRLSAVRCRQVITVEPPINVELEVTDTDPGVKGNTASGARWRGVALLLLLQP
jgi:hypothetical protein